MEIAQAFVGLRVDGKHVKADTTKAIHGADMEGEGKKAGSRFAAGMGAVVGVAAAAGLVSFGRNSVNAFKDAEAAQARLSDAFAKFPALADINRSSLDKLNTSLAQKTRFDDDALASGQAVLAQFGLTGQQVSQLTPLLADYAAKTGTDIPTAAEQLGKGLLGQGRALKSVGIDFQDAGSVGANFEQIMGGLRTQVGGFAEGEGKTAAGQSEILKNRFGELQELVGSKLIPALNGLAVAGIATLAWMEDNNELVAAALSVMGAFAVILGVVKVAQLASAAASAIAAAATSAWTAAQWLLNAALTANPIGIVVVALAALVAAVIIAYKNSETFRDIVQAAWQGIQAVVSFAWNSVIKPALEAIVAFVTGVLAPTVLWLWRNIFEPAFNAIGQIIGVWWGVVRALFEVAMAFIQNVLAPVITWLWRNVFEPVFRSIGEVVTFTWNSVIKPVFEALGNFIKNTVAPAFSAGVSAIESAWNRMIEIAKVPVRFVVNTVINKGIIDTFNKVAGFFGADTKVNHVTLPFARGGIYPGYTPGRDVGFAAVSGGEAIMRPEWTRAVGADYVNAANAAARTGSLGQFMGGFADGGIIDRIIGGVVDIVGDAVEFITDPGKILTGVVDRMLGGLGDSPLANIAAAVPKKLVGLAVEKIKSTIAAMATAATGGGGNSLGGLMPYVAAASTAITRMFGITNIGGYSYRNIAGTNTLSDHATGRALDVMTTNVALGNAVKAFGLSLPMIKYAIWRQVISYPNGSSSMMSDRGSPTQNHMDHVHLSFYDKGGWLPPGRSMAVNNTGSPERVLGPADMIRIHPDSVNDVAAVVIQGVLTNNARQAIRARAGTRS